MKSYAHLDSGARAPEFLALKVLCARPDAAGEQWRISGEESRPTIPDVRIGQAPTFINERRVLVVSFNSDEPAGTLGYSVVVRPGYSAGDHYHHRREERVLVLHGRAQFRLLDCRQGAEDAPGNIFDIDYPGTTVTIPPGVAHAIIADGAIAVLQVLASNDYDPTDDVHVALSSLPLETSDAARIDTPLRPASAP